MLLRKDISNDVIFYQVKSGDSLSAIIKQYYGSISLQQKKNVLSKIMADNPEIKNPNIIYPGQILAMDIPKNYCPVPGLPKLPVVQADEQAAKTLKKILKKTTPREKDLISAIAPIMLGTGTSSMMMIDKTFKSNTPTVVEIVESYNDYKADKLTKGQYDYRRKILLNKLKTKLGPTNLLLNGAKSPNEVLRISRKKGSVPTEILTQQINRMSALSKLATRGGVVLSVAGLGIACHQIANTDDKQQKNEILVESLGGLGGGVLYGVAATATVMLMATPVGWTAALVIGAGSVLSSYGAGMGVKHLYTAYGAHIDVASVTKVSELCK